MVAAIQPTPAFKKAVARFMRRCQQNLDQRGSLHDVGAVYGNRYVKIVQMVRSNHKLRSAAYFIDMQPGITHGLIYQAESWSRPRKWHFANVLHLPPSWL